jgi:hypothetical protein
MVTKGVACPTENCQVRMHYHCLTKWMATHRKCTTCDKDWPANADNMKPVGEGAARGEERRRVRKAVDNSDDEENEADEEEPSQPRTQQSGKGKGKQADDSMDVDEEEEEEEDVPAKAPGKRRASRR